jgi:hypothetical protein
LFYWLRNPLSHLNNSFRTLQRSRHLIPVAVLALSSCIAGAPTLNDDQEHTLSSLTVYPLGQLPTKPYTVLDVISAADCSGSPMGGRVSGDVNRAMDTLKRKAAAINADSIIDVTCGAAPMINNCWAAQKCTGRPFRFQRQRPPPDNPIN